MKHRAGNETRTIPIPPELVRLLRAHIKRYGTTPDGRIFQTARGGIIQDSGYNEVWTEARRQALTPAQQRSPLGTPASRPPARAEDFTQTRPAPMSPAVKPLVQAKRGDRRL